MKTRTILILLLVMASGLAAFDLRTLKSIQVAQPVAWPEKEAAEELNRRLKSLLALEVPIATGPVQTSEPAIFVGREAATASGLVSKDELEALRYDGYLVRISPSGIALAGYRARGTLCNLCSPGKNGAKTLPGSPLFRNYRKYSPDNADLPA